MDTARRRSWRAVVVALFGALVLLGTLIAHESVEVTLGGHGLQGVPLPTAAAAVVEPGVGPAVEPVARRVVGVVDVGAGSVVERAAGTAVAAALTVASAAGADDGLLLHCLTALAGTCVVAVVGALLCLALRRGPGVALRVGPRPVQRPVGPTAGLPASPVRLRLCVAQV